MRTTTSLVMKSESATRSRRPNDSTSFTTSARGSNPFSSTITLISVPAFFPSLATTSEPRRKSETSGIEANYPAPTAARGQAVGRATILIGARRPVRWGIGSGWTLDPVRLPRCERPGGLAAQPDPNGVHPGLPHHPGAARSGVPAADGRDGGDRPAPQRSRGPEAGPQVVGRDGR